MSLGGAYLSGIPSNPDYFDDGFQWDWPIINPFPFGDSPEVLDERITDTPYGYKVNLAIGYSHLFWGIRPEIEFAFLSNAGLFDKKEICGERPIEEIGIIDPDPDLDPPDAIFVEFEDNFIYCDREARNIAYGSVNFIVDIPFGDVSSTGLGSSPYIGIGFGAGTCNENNYDDDDDIGWDSFLFWENNENEDELSCKGGLIQGILGFRSQWDSYFSSIIDFRYTRLNELDIFSLNIGFLQQF